jgi:glycosyltransferase involved in cell wall biosynthesis
MKIGVVVVDSLQSGGGFNQALNAVLQMGRLCAGRFEIEVYCYHKESLPFLKRLGFSAKNFQFSLTDRIALIANMNPLIGRFVRSMFPVGRFERMLLADGVDLVFFTAPTVYSVSLTRLNYIATVWDLCHRDMPEFPEARIDGAFETREVLYRSSLSKAVLVIADSEKLVERITWRYGIDEQRILAMPFSPAPFLVGGDVGGTGKRLVSDDYFFYPAQFWSHKNHVRILEAIRLLKERNILIRVAFCGKDYGNLDWVREQADKLDVEGQVHFLGFVSPEEMNALYDNCLAVLMPTYYGPTNIPPLEAWLKGKPLIYSKHLHAHSNEAAWLVDPDSAESLAEGMEAMLRSEIREEFTRRGYGRLQEILSERNAAEDKLLSVLSCFDLRRKLWR